jgi:hypothetical protein
MLNPDTHLILSVGIDVLLDVLVCEPPVREELTSGVGVPFEEASDSVDYCILFHAD